MIGGGSRERHFNPYIVLTIAITGEIGHIHQPRLHSGGEERVAWAERFSRNPGLQGFGYRAALGFALFNQATH